MARSAPPDRLEQLVDCATRVFVAQGYRRTQMADVAEAMGVAKGTLYLYVESKEALFDLVVRYGDAEGRIASPPAFPVATPRRGATLRYVREELARQQIPATLARALESRARVDLRSELEAIVRELYGLLARNRRRLKLIDVCAREMPELGALWFSGARGGLIAAFATYLDDRIRRKLVRPVPDTSVAARLIIETTVFWAVHRHWDAHPEAVEDAVAAATVVRFIVGALAKESD
ncbi:MAG: TetR/AcrR family transcriptional regulator [Candidatus Binatia bacterium]